MPHFDTSRHAQASNVAADMKIREAAAVLDRAIDDIGPKIRALPEGARDFRTALDERIRSAARTRPYTTLAIAGFAGFLFAVTRRRSL